MKNEQTKIVCSLIRGITTEMLKILIGNRINKPIRVKVRSQIGNTSTLYNVYHASDEDGYLLLTVYDLTDKLHVTSNE